MSRTWYTADTHFGHKKIIDFCDRPYPHVEVQDNDLIRRWNTVVAPDDIVFHLGDLALGDIERTLPRTQALHGQRFLIPGNHDRMFSGARSAAYRDEYRIAYEAAGWTILPEIVPTTIGGHPVILSHFPASGDSHGPDRWTGHRPADDGTPIIHGHVHGEWAEYGTWFNVGVDVRGFTPVAEETIIVWLDQLAGSGEPRTS